MPFANIEGQDLAVAQLRRALAQERLAHAYLFSGPEGVGKTTTALFLARKLLAPAGEELLRASALESHPDFHHLYPDGNSIKIKQIRELKDALNKYASLASGSVVLIEQADAMTMEAANAFLKTLEEPLGNVLFLLLTSQEERLPKTILSRVQRVIFRPLTKQTLSHILSAEEEFSAAEPLRRQLALQLAGGSLTQARAFLSQNGHQFIADRDRLFQLFQNLPYAHPGEALLYTEELQQRWQADLKAERQYWQSALDDARQNGEDETPWQKALKRSDRSYRRQWIRLQVLFLQQFLSDVLALKQGNRERLYHPDLNYLPLLGRPLAYHQAQNRCQESYRQLETNSDPFLILAVLLQQLAHLL